jgi:hypothetical protein
MPENTKIKKVMTPLFPSKYSLSGSGDRHKIIDKNSHEVGINHLFILTE